MILATSAHSSYFDSAAEKNVVKLEIRDETNTLLETLVEKNRT